MRRRINIPRDLIDTTEAAPLCGLSVKSLGVYRTEKYKRFGPPWHTFNNTPCYSIAELRAWAAGRIEKAKAKTQRLDFDWVDAIAREAGV